MVEAPADIPASASPPRRDDPAVPLERTARPPNPPEIEDVWSRTAPKYRYRSIALLIVNFLLFCGLCVFTHWLHVGRLFEFTWDSYFAPLNFLTAQSPNLNDFVLFPIDVTKVPAHAFVLGLLVASIVAVPILVSILYRFPAALPFVAAVFAFAHMPWMAVTLTASCILASVRPFRMKFRFGSALVALLPVLLYLFLATRGGVESLEQASPAQRSLLTAPWILAVLAACLMLGIVLLISRAVNYRPGAVAPALAVMFATPVVLFHTKVGADELSYRILEAQYGPRSPRFEASRDARPAFRGLVQRISSDQDLFNRYGAEVGRALEGRPSAIRRLLLQQLQLDFLAERAAAHEAFRRFRIDHPDSRYTSAVLYLHGRVMDTRLDERVFDLSSPRRELYNDFPHVQSESIWAELFERHRGSDLSIVGGLRLAQLQLRKGRTDAAHATLREVVAAQPAPPRRGTDAPGVAALLLPTPPEESLAFDPRPYLAEARRLEELIRLNSVDRAFGTSPISELARLDPRRTGYAAQLERLLEATRGSLLEDNLRVRVTDLIADPAERLAALTRLLEQLPPRGDALPEAVYRVGEGEVAGAAEKDPQRRTRGMERLRDLVARFANSYWASQAAELIDRLEPRRVDVAAK